MSILTIFGRLKASGDGSEASPRVPHVRVDAALAGMVPLGDEQLTGLSEAKGLTVPEGAVYALIQASAKDVRWRDNGEAPTASRGIRLLADSDFLYAGDLSAIRFIEAEASATLDISYYGVA